MWCGCGGAHTTNRKVFGMNRRQIKNQLDVLETFVKEEGQFTGEVSGAQALQAIELLVKNLDGEQTNVKDRLPELRQKVLVFVPDDMVGWDVGMIVGTAERQISDPPQTVWELWGSGRRTTGVTHWMLLPERPKQEGPFCFADGRVKFIKDGEAIASFMARGASEPVVEKVIEWVNKMLATANLEDSPRLEGPFSWRDSDRRALLFRKGGFPRDRIELTLVVPEIAALRDWLNELWAKHKP